MDIKLKLSRLMNNDRIEQEEKLKQICCLTQQVVSNANRVSLWRFDDTDQPKIICMMGYDSTANAYWSDMELFENDFPDYFCAIFEGDIVSASNARKHKATECFNTLYFEPNNIYSLLDFVIHKHFKPVGVICCERTGEPVKWSAEDEENLRSIATLISFFFDF